MAIDLRSDTVTRPSQGMRDAITSAPVGDDVYSDDPTVNSLEERVAALFGKEAGLFTPTGSLANQLAIRMLVNPGEEIIAETNSHIVRAELGAAAVFSGITTRTWPANYGLLKAADALEIARPDSGPYLVSTTAIAVENTHNFGGGTVQPLDEIKALRKGADAMGLALHLDGARIWNALVSKGESTQQYGKVFDTISVCLSKGLGCPIGSVLIGDSDIMKNAIRIRKIFGGNMRQVGYLAAAGLYALDNHIERLSEDHKKAKELEGLLSGLSYIKVVEPVETNIVIFELNNKISETDFIQKLKKHNILIIGMGSNKLRMVTHLDYTDVMHETVLKVLKNLM